MTQEQKAKAYDEALEIARKSWFDNREPGYKHYREFLESMFPELCESEDERIRKRLITLIRVLDSSFFTGNNPSKEQCLAYLEKQKELFESGRGLYYYDGEKTTYCGYPATEDNPYDFAISQQEKQKEQKPISFNEPYNPDDYEVVMEGNATGLKRKEQNLEEEDHITPNKKFFQWIYDRLVFIHGENPDVDYMRSLKDRIEGMTSKQKPAEWSEEDEHNLNSVISLVHSTSDGAWGSCIGDRIENWLKSLRPSWKPSEQEKGALRTAIYVLTDERSFPKTAAQLQNILNAFEGEESRKDWKPSEEQMGVLWDAIGNLKHDGYKNAEIIESLYEQLKKLM